MLARAVMPHGWDWVWVTLMMIFWVFVFGLAVYVAVKVGIRPARSLGRRGDADSDR